MADNGKVLIVAGEASGDGYAARVVNHLKKIRPGVDVYGVGGNCLRKAGARLILHISQLSTYGVFEVFVALPRLVMAFFKILGSIKRERPDLVIFVDYPDFNIRLARFIRWFYGRNPKIFYYIPPQVWIWRKWRAKMLAKLADRVAVVFPFEKPVFSELGVDCDFVGHPLMENLCAPVERALIRESLGVSAGSRVVALLPGSRRGEINSYLPAMAEAAQELSREGDYEFVLPRADTVSEKDVEEHLRGCAAEIKLLDGRANDALCAADMAVVALGTATLEAALMGTPAVLVGKVHPLTYWFGKRFLGMDLPYYSLVNFIAGRRAFPELIQDDMTGPDIARAVREIMANPAAMKALKKAAEEIKTALLKGEDETGENGGDGASARAAIIANKMISETP